MLHGIKVLSRIQITDGWLMVYFFVFLSFTFFLLCVAALLLTSRHLLIRRLSLQVYSVLITNDSPLVVRLLALCLLAFFFLSTDTLKIMITLKTMICALQIEFLDLVCSIS